MTTSTTAGTATFFFTFKYRDARRAYAWLQEAFGFEPGALHEDGGRVVHAELFCGSGGIMFGDSDGERVPASGAVFDRPGVYAVVEDAAIDGHYERARAAGAEITRELHDTEYGSREFTALDVEGNAWSFGTYEPERPVTG